MSTCPVCSSADAAFYVSAKDIEYYTSDETFDLYRCGDCEAVYLDPMPVDRLDEIYPSNYYSFMPSRPTMATAAKQFFDKRRFRKLMRNIEGGPVSVLDVGGGTGWLLEQVKAVDPRVTHTTVVDLDTGARDQAERNGHSFFCGRIEDYEADHSYDLVLMLNLIEHVPDPRAVLQKIRGLLKPGGLVFIQTPNYDSLDERIFRRHSWAGFHTPRHFVLFTKDGLKQLAEECGFSVDRHVYVQGAPFWTSSTLDLLKRMGLIRVSAENPAPFHPLTPYLQIGFAAFDMLRSPFSKLSQMEFVLRADRS